ncbi:chromosome partitioning protein ParA [Haloarculaceae archaeon H-GB2-1]|nr:chromosome partitioning protein ParA [Haloarculaceae archaeon H-GB1-1]MEA5388415.1 chromosome partitioning protein ParA [Haloarculaceae archaeon H-GB11]MEA5406452.1 chromosome partitioning protein ParA [Haloarculaceae archaeon H-GB2-1]
MILAVTGGKGGVGKSTVAYNLGAELDAVVVDGDLGMADLPASRGPDLHDVLAGRASVFEAVREDGPVTLLPCGRSLAGAKASDPTALVEVVERVADEYGRVVIDCPAGMRADVGLPLYAATACVVVTTPHRTALTDALRVRELARELDAGLVAVVLNRAHSEERTTTVERRLGAPVTKIPESTRLAASSTWADPVASVAPESEVHEQFRTLATSIQSSLRS